jgi:type III pantothenate kinase
MNVVALDVGNTNVTVGLFHAAEGGGADELIDSWRLVSERARTADEWWTYLSAVTGRATLDAAVVGSVVPQVTAELERAFRRHRVPLAVVDASRLPVRLAVDPAEVGADRVANAVAAARRHPLPAAVVDFGTATTLDVIAGDGTYLGGAIAPGVMTALQALMGRAARLSHVDIFVPARSIGRSTADALRVGLLHGTAGQVDRLIELAEGEAGPFASVVATGGLAEWVAPVSRRIGAVDPDLTLWGLLYCWRLSQGQGEPA